MADPVNREDLAEALADTLAQQVTEVAGKTLLRIALTKLREVEPGEAHYTALVYQALMAASDAGYPCGILGEIAMYNKRLKVACIDLPTGQVSFIVVPYRGQDEYDGKGAQLARIAEYLESRD